ncbi:hypothetical protein BJY16_006812 [Actinoplanes octamycinicus]|uniref:Uncharacterized protein n=1 Tax=Actinoplanes octamycinicus TaxID=135948 RepID=A0A7W7H3J4_9ACTN|nr:hypothetical protein [Actinoplanes octamycinicus]MBB4743353.1 hypothetical protein [Actinoplanes octamycinicus]GIE61869.1 hypothetical protein Aoc01nite_72710 [Actinoplanes octamycinicus]
MTDEEIVERIRKARRREPRQERIGEHTVLVDTVRLPGGVLTTVHRVRDGQVTVLQAGAGSFREDVARALLDVPAVPAATVQPVPIDVPGLRLDRALVLGPVGEQDEGGQDEGGRDKDREKDGQDKGGQERGRNDEWEARAVTVVAVHHSEILPGESPEAFATASSSRGTGLAHHLDDWNRQPVPRADARLLDDWPGGVMRRSERFHPWHAERMLTRVAPDGPSGVRVEVRSMAGHVVVLRREWDRGVGTLTFPDGTATPVDLPRHELWARLGPIFLGDGGDDRTGLVTVAPGTPEVDVLEMRYQTEDHGWASLPRMDTLDSCVARLDHQILRTPGNWAVFTSRSDAVIQVECTEDGGLWLETPDPATQRSLGRLVTVQEASSLLELLAREDRSAVPELPGVETVAWD